MRRAEALGLGSEAPRHAAPFSILDIVRAPADRGADAARPRPPRGRPRAWPCLEAARRSDYSEAIDLSIEAIEAIGQCEAKPQRDERELAYRLNLASALVAARGFMAAGVAAEMERAVALSGRLNSADSLVPALISKCIVLGASGNVRASLELSMQVRETPPARERLAESRTIRGGGVAGVATVGAAGVEALAEAQGAVLPLVPHLGGLRWAFIAAALAGIGVAIYARIDDWNRGQR